MRILYDSKFPQCKIPFGTLTPEQPCELNIHIPVAVQASEVTCIILGDDGTTTLREIPFEKKAVSDLYEIWGGDLRFSNAGLYFYHFHIANSGGSFRLFKQGDDTNMEDGSLWQVSCIPAEFHTPDWAKGAVIYQVFPDRFHKAGSCDLTGKLAPYTVHKDWYEEVDWRPTPDGKVLNNDFYGGNFRGITEKMDYIASLGATVLYLNPISKSFSSHRYDTGDYKAPDPMLGTLEEFREMVASAHDRGIRVILDGVYSHTGSNSPYFNREGQFDSIGAYQSQESPYYSWYTFRSWPDSYNAWWDFDTLPTVNKMDPDFIRFIITDEDSVIAFWLKQGADGFRLDVVDELPDEFVKLLYDRVKEINPEACVLGEVWEDASNKIAYGRRRTYFTGGELDSVMNYPFRTAIINFVRGLDGGRELKDTVMTLVENYPQEVVHCSMNLLGSHDTPRILTALVDDFEGSREECARRRLSRDDRNIAMDRLMMASFLQYALPGSPSLYYGDEACMEGFRDPFNRRPYPWGRETLELLAHYRRLGQLRKDFDALRLGGIRFFEADGKRIGFIRSYQGCTLRVYINRSDDPWEVPHHRLCFGANTEAAAGDRLIIGAQGYCMTADVFNEEGE